MASDQLARTLLRFLNCYYEQTCGEYAMKQLNQCCRVMLPVFLFTLTGCANIQKAIESGASGLRSAFAEESPTTSAHDITSRLIRADQANDRIAARNTLSRELINDSDQACSTVLASIPEQVEKWKFESGHTDKLEKILTDGINQRQLDAVNPALALNQPAITNKPKQQLGESIVSMIKKQRGRIRLTLAEREDMDIHRYTLKQALQDVQAYHRTCSVDLGLSEVARSTSQGMSAEEKQAKIESLLQLRQTLMQQGLNTRAVQQKIDAVVLEN